MLLLYGKKKKIKNIVREVVITCFGKKKRFVNKLDLHAKKKKVVITSILDAKPTCISVRWGPMQHQQETIFFRWSGG